MTVNERSASFRTARDLLADPTRRRIVELLRERPHRAGELASEFSISVPAVSRHLRQLREAGIVGDARVAGDGRIRVYSLVGTPPVPPELRRGRIGFRPAGAGEPAPPLTAPIEALAVEAGPHRLALDSAGVRRIVPYERPTPVPLAPFGVEGVLDTGEAIVPVVDLRVRLLIPPAAPDGRTRLVLLDTGGGSVALRVDATAETATVAPGAVAPAPELALGEGAGFVLGIARMPGGLAVLIDPAELLEG
jgi:chemotaxis signal transduction protein